MNALDYAIVAMIQADPVMQAGLYSFQGHPAVFTFVPVPEVDPGPPPKLPLPFVVSEPNVADVEDDTKDLVGHDIHRDVRIYDYDTADPRNMNMWSMRLRDIFHRQEKTLQYYILNSGDSELFTVGQCWVTHGPVAAPVEVDEYVQGRILSLVIRLTRIPSTMPYPI